MLHMSDIVKMHVNESNYNTEYSGYNIAWLIGTRTFHIYNGHFGVLFESRLLFTVPYNVINLNLGHIKKVK